jgi:hypothetical protein
VLQENAVSLTAGAGENMLFHLIECAATGKVYVGQSGREVLRIGERLLNLVSRVFRISTRFD